MVVVKILKLRVKLRVRIKWKHVVYQRLLHYRSARKSILESRILG